MPCDQSDTLPYTSYFFDLDGTLVDSASDILTIIASVLQENGHTVPRLGTERIGPRLEDIMGEICPHLPQEELFRLVQLYRARYRDCNFNKSLVYSGIPAVLDRLRRKGYSLFVATNKPLDVTRKLLEIKGLLCFFTDIACSNSVEGQVLSKEAMLRLLLHRHDIKPESSVMIGDSVLDMRGGQAAGLSVIAALYGYGHRDDLLATDPDGAVPDQDWSTLLCLKPHDRR